MVTQIPDETMDQLSRLAEEAGLSLPELLAAARVRDFERGLGEEQRRQLAAFRAEVDKGYQQILRGEGSRYDSTVQLKADIEQLAEAKRHSGTPVKDAVKPL